MTETVLSLDLQGWVNLYKSSRDVGRVGLQMPTHIKVTSTWMHQCQSPGLG